MSGQGNVSSVAIDGRPIASEIPTDGQVLTFSAASGQWTWKTLPISQFFSARGSNNVIPSAGVDIPMESDYAVGGTDITRVSFTTFQLSPGTYNIEFSIIKATFGSASGGERILLQLYNATTSTFFGVPVEIVNFGGTTTVVCSLSTYIGVEFSSTTLLSVRATTVNGTTPVIDSPLLSIYKRV